MRELLERLRNWLTIGRSWNQEVGYRRQVAHRVEPIQRPPELEMYVGMWVATIDGEVVAAEPTSQRLAVRLHDMDHRRRDRAVVEFVRPSTDSFIVGVG